MKKKIAVSYSGGKDGILALYRAIKSGYEPVVLITTYNTDMNRSWFHGIPEGILGQVSASLGIPLRLIKTSGKEYAENFGKALADVKELGVEACVFGDIDIDEHRSWCTERCENAGIKAIFPLWNEKRESLVYEFIDSGFTANLTIIDTKQMNDGLVGETLSRDTIKLIENQGADICGENGEYHTFVSDGPIFRKKIKFHLGDKIIEDGYAIKPLIDDSDKSIFL